jgi:uncharacterized protein with HEPN domain
MSTSDAAYLRDLLRELDDVVAFTVDGKAAFMTDVKTQKANIRSYEVAGEICKRLSPNLRTENIQIDWRTLITFRDFLAHNYEFITLRYIWDAVQDLPNLRASVEVILAALPEDGDED